MIIGYTSKYCHFCNKQTPHEGHQSKELVYWVCLNQQHINARLLAEKD